jgi:hypothetical protein
MAVAITTMNNLSGAVSSGTFASPAQQTSFLDTTNPRYPRLFQFSDVGLKISSSGTTIGIFNSDIMDMVVSHFPAMTWPPAIQIQPSSGSIAKGTATSIGVFATSELPMSFQWDISTDGGNTYKPVDYTIFNGTVLRHLVPAAVIIQNAPTSLNGNMFKCEIVNLSGTTVSRPATLMVG